MANGDGSETHNESIKNLHVEVPESFHRKVKMLCVMQGATIKDYAFEALREKVGRDEDDIANGRKPGEG